MPRLSVWFVRASFVHLLLGLFFGALILAQKDFILSARLESLSLHVEFPANGLARSTGNGRRLLDHSTL
ncbi:MAG: hypothetical protein IPG44_12535 [Anaerolineales bacterium]|nr:hypothetical protein [Anaerolineales bacterium]